MSPLPTSVPRPLSHYFLECVQAGEVVAHALGKGLEQKIDGVAMLAQVLAPESIADAVVAAKICAALGVEISRRRAGSAGS